MFGRRGIDKENEDEISKKDADNSAISDDSGADSPALSSDADIAKETSSEPKLFSDEGSEGSPKPDNTPQTDNPDNSAKARESQKKAEKANALFAEQQDDSDDENDDEDSEVSQELSCAKEKIYDKLMELIDLQMASQLEKSDLQQQIIDIIGEVVMEEKLAVNATEQQNIANEIVDDMLGLGPLEPLLKDEAVTDIMINGPFQIYIERKGKLQLSDIKFRDEQHVMNIAQRIVTAVGRRVDESSPICDARLLDGSRVNVIAPPLSLKGCSISIRKFAKQKITLDVMEKNGNITPELCKVLKIAAACRLNIIISGGTGSGKTTMLNAMSRLIDHGERVVTIEDAAELQLQQPHVVPLETRPANLEGQGEITMRDLVKNSLRMRPDRIILGEVRGGEALDLLQAMNTGHDGSMGTLHANNPREALTRLENMCSMAEAKMPMSAVRHQIASAVHLIIQVQRMRDGVRRTTHVSEVVGMEGDVVVTQDLFKFEFIGEDESGKLVGEFKSTGLRPHFTPKAAYFGLDEALIAAMG